MLGPSSVPRDLKFLRALNATHWFQQIDLGGGVVTPGSQNTARLLKRLGLPPSLKSAGFARVGIAFGIVAHAWK